jgi:hypothetical protein
MLAVRRGVRYEQDTADGKPDFSGIWHAPSQKYLANLAADGIQVPMTPWAQQIFKQRADRTALIGPSASCLPHSVTDFDAHNTPRKVLQSPGLIVMLYEGYHTFRQIFTDGRPLPKDPEPAWFGYSVGHWEATRSLLTRQAFTKRRGWTTPVIRTATRCMSSSASGA